MADLEDELIHALGMGQVEEIIRAEGDLRAWHTFLRQPAHHGRPRQQQLRRFRGTKKGRTRRYGHLLVEDLDPWAGTGPTRRPLHGLVTDGRKRDHSQFGRPAPAPGQRREKSSPSLQGGRGPHRLALAVEDARQEADGS